jgi:SPFH domain / Band 7 family
MPDDLVSHVRRLGGGNSVKPTSHNPKAVRRGVLAGVIAVLLIIVIASTASSFSTPEPGTIGVVRSGTDVWPWPYLNGHNIRGTIAPGSGKTFIGFGSTVHYYPSDSVQRTYTITSNPNSGDLPGVDVVTVPTSDGVQVGIEGTFYFTTAFNGSPAGTRLVRDFDNRFGVRTFSTGVQGQGAELHAWDGTDGWEAFLDQVIRPVINADLRASIGGTSCAQLVSSCALVHQASVATPQGNGASIQAVENQINGNLEHDIQNVLGEDYFSNITFLLNRVTLPTPVQNEIDEAQAQYAAVAASAAKVQQARLDAQANQIRESGYKDCPACAQIDVYKAIPPTITTFAPGAGVAITPGH